MTSRSWKGKNLELIKEASRHGEAKLSAQVQIATSADQRATVLAGIYVAAATGIIGAVATGDAFKHNLPLVVGSVFSAVAFLIAAYLCIVATLPVDFYVPGNEPEKWYDDIDANTPPEEAIGQQAAHFNDQILANNKTIASNARYFQIGALTGISAPIIGLVGAGLTCLLASALASSVAALAHP
ncbi:MAG TPA: hypothetical protein VJ476_13250 [Rhizomicrobium sp.]|nr:hypothetical protein [Rhizomicrobium sp.]